VLVAIAQLAWDHPSWQFPQVTERPPVGRDATWPSIARPASLRGQ
jgi:hypothetical protein